MNITFLIGNGFDIGLGLNTRYTDFYKKYCSDSSNDNDNISDFKRILRNWNSNKEKKIIDWSDFERAFGEHSLDFDLKTKKQYIERFKDFAIKFNEYLEEESKKLDYDDNIVADIMHSGVMSFHQIREADRIILDAILKQNANGNIKYNFVSFNYTNTVDRCVNSLNKIIKNLNGYEIGEVLHIHGYIEENMILGVNDSSQIKNQSFAKDLDIQKILVKPRQNSEARTTCDGKLSELINSSDLICTYGMSIGITDKKWWGIISQWLISNSRRYLVILSHENNYDVRFPFVQTEIVDKYKQRILECSGYSVDVRNKIETRILVGINNDIFKMNLRKVDNEPASLKLIESKYDKNLSLGEYYDQL